MESFYNVGLWNKLKGFVFSVIRLKCYMNFFTGMFLQVLYLPRTTAAQTMDLEEGFLRILILAFQSLGTMTWFLFKSHVGNET